MVSLRFPYVGEGRPFSPLPLQFYIADVTRRRDVCQTGGEYRVSHARDAFVLSTRQYQMPRVPSVFTLTISCLDYCHFSHHRPLFRFGHSVHFIKVLAFYLSSTPGEKKRGKTCETRNGRPRERQITSIHWSICSEKKKDSGVMLLIQRGRPS